SEYTITAHRRAISGLLSTNYQRRDFDGTNHREYRAIDRGFLNEIQQMSRVAVSLCGRLERFQKRHAGHVLKQPRSQPVPLDEILKSKARRRPQKMASRRKHQT